MDERLEFLIQESRKPNDPRRNNELVAILREQDGETILSVVDRMINMGCPNMFAIAKRVLREKRHVTEFFWNGLDKADKSNVQTWVEIALHKLGARTTFELLLEKEKERSGIVEDALYFLPGQVRKEEAHLLQMLR